MKLRSVWGDFPRAEEAVFGPKNLGKLRICSLGYHPYFTTRKPLPTRPKTHAKSVQKAAEMRLLIRSRFRTPTPKNFVAVA
jgi:hypothetical protein